MLILCPTCQAKVEPFRGHQVYIPRHPKPKLKQMERNAEIVKCFEKGASPKDIAISFKLTKSRVHQILKLLKDEKIAT